MLTCCVHIITDTRPHMQALRDHVISQISEDRLQPLAYKLGLSQEAIDQLPVGKRGIEVVLKEWLKSGQRKWLDLKVALCCPQVNEQNLSDSILRKLTNNGMVFVWNSVVFKVVNQHALTIFFFVAVIQQELSQLTPTECQVCDRYGSTRLVCYSSSIKSYCGRCQSTSD